MPVECDFADGVMIGRLCEKRNWKKRVQFEAAIKDATGEKVSEPTLKRALKGDPMTADILGKIAKALEVPPWVVTIPRNQKRTSYAWEDIMAGARNVARKITFKRPPADAVLTFPCGSSIFAGLVLMSLRDPQRFLRIPVYTAMFKELAEADLDNRRGSPEFRVATTLRYKILVPKALFDNRHKRVIVIEDATLSGGTMEKLRELLEPYFGKDNLTFACCICDQSLTYGNRKRPDIIGLPGVVQGPDFTLPWGKPYANEDAFPGAS